MYERKGGQAHPSFKYISGFDMIRFQACLEIVGSGWIHTITHLNPFVCPFLQFSNKNTLYTRLFQSGEKERSKCMNGGGGQAPPSLEYMSGVNVIRYGWIWLDTHTIPFIWPCVMTSVSTEKFDFNRNWETQKSTQSKHIISQKNILYKDSPGNKHKKGKHKSIKTWCLRSASCFSVCNALACFLI